MDSIRGLGKVLRDCAVTKGVIGQLKVCQSAGGWGWLGGRKNDLGANIQELKIFLSAATGFGLVID